MSGFTIRDLLWLMVVVVIATAGFFLPSKRENDRHAARRHMSEYELELIRAHYEAAKAGFEWYSGSYYGGRRSITSVCEAIERFANATQVSNDLETQIADLARALKMAQAEASIMLDKYENDVEPAKMVYRVQYTRADMEARLRRAEQDLAAAQGAR